MVFHNQKGRNISEIKILRNTINNWKYTHSIFNNYPEINKAGLFPNCNGIVWFNFFWIRGSFLKSIPPPIITTDRYYYEHQFIKNQIPMDNCFNLLYFNKIMNSVPFTACRHLDKLSNTFELNLDFFNFKKYILKYPDLKQLKSKRLLYHHFKINGINENRNLI